MIYPEQGFVGHFGNFPGVNNMMCMYISHGYTMIVLSNQSSVFLLQNLIEKFNK